MSRNFIQTTVFFFFLSVILPCKVFAYHHEPPNTVSFGMQTLRSAQPVYFFHIADPGSGALLKDRISTGYQLPLYGFSFEYQAVFDNGYYLGCVAFAHDYPANLWFGNKTLYYDYFIHTGYEFDFNIGMANHSLRRGKRGLYGGHHYHTGPRIEKNVTARIGALIGWGEYIYDLGNQFDSEAPNPFTVNGQTLYGTVDAYISKTTWRFSPEASFVIHLSENDRIILSAQYNIPFGGREQMEFESKDSDNKSYHAHDDIHSYVYDANDHPFSGRMFGVAQLTLKIDFIYF